MGEHTCQQGPGPTSLDRGNKLSATKKRKQPQTNFVVSRLRLLSLIAATRCSHGPKRCRYSVELMKALTMSAFWKLPLNWFSLASQKLNPGVSGLRRR